MKMNLLKEKKEKKATYNILSLNNLNCAHLLKIRVHIGHKNKELDKKMNSLVLGTFQNISIMDPLKCLVYWERSLKLFSQMFLHRNTFFIISTNKNFSNSFLGKFLYTQFIEHLNVLPQFSGFVTDTWNGGLLSNWRVLWLFIRMLINKQTNKKLNKKKHLKLLKYAAGRSWKGVFPTFPDFILALTADKVFLREAFYTKICTIALVDSNKNPEHASISIPGNDDSFKVIQLFLQLLEEGYHQGSLEEKELFYNILIESIKEFLYK